MINSEQEYKDYVDANKGIYMDNHGPEIIELVKYSAYEALQAKLKIATEALEGANKSLGYLAKHDMIDEKFNEVSQNGYFHSQQALKELKDIQ